MARRHQLTKARAFAWAKQQGPEFKSRDLAIAFGVSASAANQMLSRLRERGAVELANPWRKTWKSRWRVANPNADVSSHLGLHPRCIDNLRVNWKRSTGNSHPKSKQRKDWPARTLLESLWQLSTPSAVDASERLGSNQCREGAPSES